MNIYVCLFIDQEDTLWQYHFTWSLRKMGHNVFIPPEIGLGESWYILGQGFWSGSHQQLLTERILNDVKLKNEKYKIDLFFCYLFPFQFTPNLFKQLRKLGIPSVYFFCDNISHKIVAREYGPHATINWVPEAGAIGQFRQSGSNAVYLPMASNPDIFYPIANNEEIEISFAGTKNSYRRNILGKLINAGFKLKIYGHGWSSKNKGENSLGQNRQLPFRHFKLRRVDRLHNYIINRKNSFFSILKYGLKPKRVTNEYCKLGEEYEDILEPAIDAEHFLNKTRIYPGDRSCLAEINKIYSLSSLSIGFNEQFNSQDGIFFHTNTRNFEAATAGACYLAEATPEINDLFLDGKEIMVFRGVDELTDKAKFLLKNESFRKQMRIACYKRAISEHTWQHRFNKLFRTLGIN